MIAPLDIEASARLAGGHRWVELRLFEILGRWSAAVPVAAVQAQVGPQSLRHAWHAELWRACLPSLPHLDAERVTAAPSPALAALVEEVGDAGDRLGALEKLVGVYRLLLPRLQVAHARRRARATDVTDAPVLRALDLIGADLARDLGAGEGLVQSLVRSGADARRAAERLGWLEAALIEAGGLP